MTLDKIKVKVHVLFKEAKRLEKSEHRRIYVSHSIISLFDSSTLVIWIVCMKFYDP